MKKGLWLLAILVLLTPLRGAAFADNGDRQRDMRILYEVIGAVNNYAHFSVFDDINAHVLNGEVTLTGKVTQPFKRKDIEQRVSRLDGVKVVRNQIEVLPASSFDDELRARIARAIYGNPNFSNYAAMRNPPIHIIVERGRVTLTGVVNSEVDKALARSLASQFGAFAVVSQLKTEKELREELERAPRDEQGSR